MNIKMLPEDLTEQQKKTLIEAIDILNIETIQDWVKMVNQNYESSQQGIRLKSITIDDGSLTFNFVLCE